MILKIIMALSFFTVLIQGCIAANCINCSNFLQNNSAGKLQIKQTCFQCEMGFNKINQKCQSDEGLAIGLSIGIFLALGAQLLCYLYCHKKNAQRNRKKPIDFRQLFEHTNKDQLLKIRHLELEECKIQFENKKCQLCDKAATVKTNCNHYFDIKCFYIEIQKDVKIRQDQMEIQVKQNKRKHKEKIKTLAIKQRKDAQLKIQGETQQLRQKRLNKNQKQMEVTDEYQHKDRSVHPRCPLQHCKQRKKLNLQFAQVCNVCKRRKVYLFKCMQTAKTCRQYQCAHCKLSNLYKMDEQQSSKQEEQDEQQNAENISKNKMRSQKIQKDK